MKDVCHVVGPKGRGCSDIGVIMEGHSDISASNNCTVGNEASCKEGVGEILYRIALALDTHGIAQFETRSQLAGDKYIQSKCVV